MTKFEKIEQQARRHHPDLDDLLPQPKTANALKKISDDRFLSEMTKSIFKAGFVWRVIDQKWDGFEAAFEGFVPRYWAQVPDEVLDQLVKDKRIVRNMQKIRTVRENAMFIEEIKQSHGSFGELIANWPASELVDLFDLFKKRASRMGGASAQYFLRTVGKDTYLYSNDVATALIKENIIDKPPTSKKAKLAVQEAFNHWHQETGRPYCQISRILACSIG